MLGVFAARRVRAILLTAVLVCLSALAAAPAPFAWKNVNIQGMGYVSGLVIHPLPPYDIYIRTDVGGAYRYDRDAGRWLPLLDRYGTLQSEVIGVESIAVDPTDPNTVYLAANFGPAVNNATVAGEILVSHNRGLSWSPLGLAAQNVYMGPNDPYRGTAGERLAVDPLQPGTIYFASRQNGLWRGTLKSPTAAQWTQVAGGLPSSVPAYQGASVGMTFLVFDVSSNSEWFNGEAIYLGLYETGVMVSTDGGATWTDTKSKGSVNSYGDQPLRASIDSDGTLYVTFGGGEGSSYGNVGRYQGGTWTDISPANPTTGSRWSPGYAGISRDRSAPGTLAVTTATSGATYRSTDQGATWTQVLAANPTLSGQPAYYAQGPLNWGAALAIDPQNPKRVWETNGYGVIATEDVTAQPPVWSWRMNNLEELCVQDVKVPPYVAPASGPAAADLFSTAMDMVGFRHASRDAVPTSTLDQFPWVAQGDSFTYCASQPQNAAFVGWNEASSSQPMSGITTDNGLTWKHIPNTSPGVAGSIAMSASDPNNMVWSPTGAGPQYTLDGGNTWQQCMTSGKPMTGSWQLSVSPYWAAEVLAPDLVTGGTFYYFDNGNFYVSSDKGATWTLTNSKQLTQYALKSSIVPNPAQAGDIWMSFKPNNNQPVPFQLMRSTDGGTTFNAVPTVDQCNFVAFGKGNSAVTPFVYIHGRANGDSDDAIYKSEDLGQSWTRVSEPRMNQFGTITTLAGDMRTQDLVYVGLGCRGIQYGYGPKSGLSGSDRQPSNVLNIASQQSGAIAPGEMLTVTTSLPATSPVQINRLAANGITGTVLNSMQILFDGQPAPIVATVAGEAIVTAPYGIAGQDSVAIQLYDWSDSMRAGDFSAGQTGDIESIANLSLPLSVPVASAAPGVFTGSNGSGAAVAVNTDGRINSAAHPAAKGSTVTLYLTGAGVENQSVVDGQIAAAPLWAPQQAVTVQFGGVSSDSVTATAVRGGIAGLTQVAAIVPVSAPSGAAVAVAISVGGVTGQAGVTIAIQ